MASERELVGSGNHELNLRYGGMEATAYCGNYSGDTDMGDEKSWLSESKKIQDILRLFMEDCGVEAEGPELERPAIKKRKVDEKQAKAQEEVDGFPDVVDVQCMELLQAFLGPSGHKVLKQDKFNGQWGLMKIIQKGRERKSFLHILRSFLRKTPGAHKYEIDIGER